MSPNPSAADWSVYLILCENGALYCGISNRPAQRFAAHLAGRGARYTRMHKPKEMRLTCGGLDKSAAQKREAAVKRLNKAQKTQLWHTAVPPTDTEKPA
ncbi:GIY-YIG nuclease superfamily protein [Kingella potus]|uniref:GIY-YIG nuclease superfamily protein n=1 Tax=Kingella potus TaxID=265175 RepID=A0A377R2Z8_9NEIS|nr:GIY-YIG nuclease family protein [Kingella potus]UOP00354.1 GIY-YIG nuclease family protein [Kingella potus]STR02584.1 GIY-YIG nuclease superfamily protein [Kingella potus]